MTIGTENIEAIIETYSNTVYRLALTRIGNIHNAEDIHSEVFLRLWKQLQRCGFESDDHLKAWLIRVTINCSKTYLGSKWFRSRDEYDEMDYSEREAPENKLTDEQLDLLDAIGTLAPKYRTVIHLFYYEGYSADDAAQILGKNPATVRSQLARARAILKEKLGGDFIED